MNDIIIVALISFLGTLVGTFGGIVASGKLTNYRLTELEKKVERHNSLLERMALVEQSINSANKQIELIKEEIGHDKYQKSDYS